MFFGDLGGNFYALDAANGQKLWGQELGGAIAGGVITTSYFPRSPSVSALGWRRSRARGSRPAT